MEIPIFQKEKTIIAKTDERIAKLTMHDLKDIIESIDESDANLMINALREKKFDRIGPIFEFLTYREMQKKANDLPEMLKEQIT